VNTYGCSLSFTLLAGEQPLVFHFQNHIFISAYARKEVFYASTI
jgi:hypothetical protein